MSELSSTTLPSPAKGMDKRKQKQAGRRLQRKAGTPKSSPPKTPSPTTPHSTPHLTPDSGNIVDSRKQYLKHGLPSEPKNPKTRETVPYETALERIKNGHYGADISSTYADLEDEETRKQILFLAGRDFGAGTWSPAFQIIKMNEMLDTVGKHMRLQYLLCEPGDRDLIYDTVGAESNQESYTNTGQATGKTYKQCYGENVVTIHRYVQQDGAFGFLDAEEMKKMVFFFRFNIYGTSYSIDLGARLTGLVAGLG